MKKIFYFLMLLFMSIVVIGQKSTPKVPCDIFTDSNRIAINNQHQTSQQRSLIQLYDSVYNWQWDTLSNGWKINYRIIDMAYDPDNNLTNEIYQLLSGGSWVNHQQNIYTYDGNDNLINYLQQSWGDHVWNDSRQSTYTYDANNNLTSIFNQKKAWIGPLWIDVDRTIYYYDINNNLTGLKHETWEPNWFIDYLYTYTYDTNNNQVCFLIQISYTLENSGLYTRTFDINNNKTSELYQTWDGSTWVNNGLSTFNYNTNNNLTSELYQTWDDSTWINYWLYTFTYDASNNLILKLEQSWNGNTTVDYSQYIYTYDANNNQTGELHQYQIGSSWVNSTQNIYTYDADNFQVSNSFKEWDSLGVSVISGDSTYNYFQLIVGINNQLLPVDNISIRPNPSSSLVTVESPGLSSKFQFLVFDFSGEEVMKQQAQGTSTVLDISHLPEGVYLVRVTDERTVMTGKFVKR